jgi:hypothetical protein
MEHSGGELVVLWRCPVVPKGVIFLGTAERVAGFPSDQHTKVHLLLAKKSG